MPVEFHTVTEHEAGQRIDNFLMKRFRQVPKSVIYRILRKGEVRIDKKRAKPDRKLVLGEEVRIPPVRVGEKGEKAEASDGLLKAIESAILLEDEHLIVINKPAGLAAHGGSGVKIGLIEAFRQLRPNIPYVELVHRLDRDTSGVLLLAKSRKVLNQLQDMLRHGGIEKRYLALVAGQWQGGRKHIDLPLKREDGALRKVQVSEDGKDAESIFTPQQRMSRATLMDAEILTGRTHQIRVHLAHLGYPVLGDERYGDFALNREFKKMGVKRLFLHSAQTGFYLELSGRRYTLEAPLPDDLKQVLNALS